MLYLLLSIKVRVITFYILFQLLFSGNLFSQYEKVDFQLQIPKKIPFSYYKYIQVLDIRTDTSNIGFVTTQNLNSTALVVPERSLQEQVQNFLYFCADSVEDGELILQIRKMKFVQHPKTISEEGYFLFRAAIFSIEQNVYKQIGNIDTIVIVSLFNKEKKLQTEASNVITNFITKSVVNKTQITETKSYHEILNIDSIEKTKLKAYCIGEYVDGVYKNFSSFKKQTPDQPLAKLIFRQSGLKKVKVLNANGKKVTLDKSDVFAVIDKSKIYISAEFGYYSLFKFNGDFYFIGPGQITHSNSEAIIATLLFGAAGTLIVTTTPKNAFFQIWVDHIDGSFIRGRRIN